MQIRLQYVLSNRFVPRIYRNSVENLPRLGLPSHLLVVLIHGTFVSTFSISHAALAEIQRIFGYSKSCREPVAQLFERVNAGPLFEDIHAAIASGTKTPEELSAIARKRVKDISSDVRELNLSLMVGAEERAECRPRDLHEIGGVTFALDARIMQALHGYCLTFEDGHFFFRGADNTAQTLSSALARTKT